MPFIQNLGKLGIQANLRIVDAAQLKSRTEAFDFDVVTEALPGSTTPGVSLRVVFSSAAAAQNGSRNLAGVADPVVDALIETIAAAQSREELNTACRALDRVLRAGHYWVPMWYRDTAWVAHWDAFSRPEKPAADSAPARPAPGGGTKRRRRPLDFSRTLTLHPAQIG